MDILSQLMNKTLNDYEARPCGICETDRITGEIRRIV
jgi:hypothetical protein